MKIVCPLSNPDELAPLIDAGADEFFCGISVGGETLRCLNRFPTLAANLTGFSQLEKIVRLAHSRGVPVNFTLNCFYNEKDNREAQAVARDAISAGVDSLVVQDIGLLTMLKTIKNCPAIHIGTMGATFNAETANFYKEMGASRIVLERQMTLEEIEAISQGTDVGLEVFMLNNRCRYIDGFCTFMHGLAGLKYFWPNWLYKFQKNKFGGNISKFLPHKMLNSLKNSLFRNEFACCLDYSFLNQKAPEGISHFFDFNNFSFGCGCCGIYRLRRSRAGFIKIVGRDYATYKKILDVKFIKKTLGLLDEHLEEPEFKSRTKELFRRFYTFDCHEGYCYYP